MLKDMYNMYSSIGRVEMRVIESSECMPFVEQPFHSGTDWKGEVSPILMESIATYLIFVRSVPNPCKIAAMWTPSAPFLLSIMNLMIDLCRGGS
jgi:hypothetical protein